MTEIHYSAFNVDLLNRIVYTESPATQKQIRPLRIKFVTTGAILPEFTLLKTGLNELFIELRCNFN